LPNKVDWCITHGGCLSVLASAELQQRRFVSLHNVHKKSMSKTAVMRKQNWDKRELRYC